MQPLLNRLEPSGIGLKSRVVALLFENPFLESSATELGIRFGVPALQMEPALIDLQRAGVVAYEEGRYRFAPEERVYEEARELARARLRDEAEVRQQVVELETLSRLRDILAVTREEVVAVLEMSPSGVLLLDRFGHLLKGNHLAKQLLGLASEGPDVDVCRTLGLDLKMVLEQDVVLEVEADGERPPLEVRTRPFRVSGSDTGAMVSVEDISNRRALEEEAAKLREHFFSMIRHELRRPLLTVERYLSTTRRSSAAGSDPKGLAAAESAAGELGQMIDDMLFLARLERDPMAVEVRGRVSLRQVMAGCQMTYREAAAKRRIRLEVEPPNGVTVRGDERRLAQVIGNLLDNALKFTPDGGRVRMWTEAEAGRVRVLVEDSGPGIPERERDRVLETFYQVRGDDARLPGLGLGLAICRRVVEAHGGSIHLGDSSLGGAKVTVVLPLANDEGRMTNG